MRTQTLVVRGEVDRWEQASQAFLAEKERRSGSSRTVQAYSRMLIHFFGIMGTSSIYPVDSSRRVVEHGRTL
jgi:hypothetical protein